MTDLCSIRGIGEKTAGALNRLGILCAEDLRVYYPRDYESFSFPVHICDAKAGALCAVEGVLQKDAALNRFNGLIIVNAYISDESGKLQLSWFNMPYLKQTLKAGSHYVFRGRIYEKNGRLVMSQPKLYKPEDYREKYAGHLSPVYSLTKGVSNKLLIKAIASQFSGDLPDAEYLSEETAAKFGLLSENEAMLRMHFPRNTEELLRARKRIAFDEFLMFMLAGAAAEKTKAAATKYRCKPVFSLINFIASLPYELTEGQQKAWRDISKDMSSGRAMSRLVEGDVGSGKTIVAVLAMLNAALNGYQAAIMAPTSVLAEQHFHNISGMLERAELKLKPVLVTGSMSRAEKNAAYTMIREHEADLIIGTHALFQEAVEYADLGLIVTDEQHRFGVKQRESLKNKSDTPHTLLLSATPIPRTLAQMLYGGLDISAIETMPSGRLPIKNCVVGKEYRPKAYRFMLDEIKKGHQIYVICPAIENEDGDDDNAAASADVCNVTDYSEALKKAFKDEARVITLHGRMKPEEKDSVMAAFKAHEADILVSTTVVEVGVDVPNATVIMIENAERFGLSELHQLRGRVGRGDSQSYCIMINTSDTEKAAERLDILNKTTDGFEIASEDLRLRGPGDLYGIRQSGDLNFNVADIYKDADALKLAKEACEDIMEADPELSAPEHEKLAEKLSGYLGRGIV